MRKKDCTACGSTGVVRWSSCYASDRNGEFSMSGEVVADKRISVCSMCHGTGMRKIPVRSV